MRWMLFALLAMTIAEGCISTPQEAKNLTFETVFGSASFDFSFPPTENWDGKIPFFHDDINRPVSSSPPAYAVIINKTEWDYQFTPYRRPPTPIDFNDEFVIAHGFVYPTGGASVRILNITQSAGMIRITIEHHFPRGPATMAVTFPHHVVKIKKSELLQRGTLTFSFVYVDGTQLGNVTRFIP